jgi:hypothetical protein
MISDVYINCTLNEPYGRVIIESMEWNLPIIAYDGGSHQELIFNNFNGFLYKDIDELLERIIFFYENKELINDYGKNGNLFYKKLLDMNVNDTNNFYVELSSIFSIIINNETIPKISYDNVYNKQMKELNLLECCSILYDNNLYIHGGYTNNSQIENNNLYKLDLSDNSIISLCKIPDDCATSHTFFLLHNDNIIIISGQINVEDNPVFGKATNTFYVINITKNEFIKNQNVPFALYSPILILNDKTLTVFSGTTENRTKPNTDVWYCEILDDNGNIIHNPIWNKKNNLGNLDNFVGSAHSAIIKTNSSNNSDEYIYLDGCGCHTCSFYNMEHNIYYHAGNNYKMIIKKGNDKQLIKKISKQDFKTSHTECSTSKNDGILYSVGGQLNYDMIYNGVQLYYINLDLWVELIVSKDYLKYFTKGCISFQKEGKLYLMCGQFGDNYGNPTSIFNDNLLIFDIHN